MVKRPLLLDLFCGAGGAAVGYHLAGFDVVGVDINPQPNYPFRFHQGDALEVLATVTELDGGWDWRFDAIHASPPCQSFTAYRRKGGGVGDGYPNLIPEVRELLEATGLPYWMTLRELSEAIPPAYTEHIGRQLIAHLEQEAAA